jgi:hypothetical protein
MEQLTRVSLLETKFSFLVNSDTRTLAPFFNSDGWSEAMTNRTPSA